MIEITTFFLLTPLVCSYVHPPPLPLYLDTILRYLNPADKYFHLLLNLLLFLVFQPLGSVREFTFIVGSLCLAFGLSRSIVAWHIPSRSVDTWCYICWGYSPGRILVLEQIQNVLWILHIWESMYPDWLKNDQLMVESCSDERFLVLVVKSVHFFASWKFFLAK